MIRGLDGYMNEATFGRDAKGPGMVGYSLTDFDVVFYGDTAVACFVLDRRRTAATASGHRN